MSLRILVPVIVATFAAGAAWGQTPPGLPPEAAIAQAIAAAPGPSAAQADVTRARATADRLRAGPYEFELSAAATRRTVDADGDYMEWTGGLGRAVRWPDKRAADRDLASLEVVIAEADYASAWRAAALRWASLWSAWRAAAALAELAEASAADADALAAAEAQRVDLGAGLAVERDRLDADAALARLTAELAQRRLADAALALTIAFPDFAMPVNAPAFEDPAESPAAPPAAAAPPSSPEILAARLRLEQAELQQRRARMDTRPDPRLGLEVFSERGGDETGAGITLTFPLSGLARRAAVAEAAGRRDGQAAHLRAAEQAASQAYSGAVLRLESATRAVIAAKAASEAARSAMDRLQQGWDMQASTVTDLIAARQMGRLAETARVEALAELAAAQIEIAILEGRILPAP